MTALAVAIAIAIASLIAWGLTANSLHNQVDQTLRDRSLIADRLGGPGVANGPLLIDPESICAVTGSPTVAERLQQVEGYLQLIRADGSVCAPQGHPTVTPTQRDIAIANGSASESLREDYNAANDHLRVLTRPLGDGYALMMATELTDIDRSLSRLTAGLLAANALGILAAITAGLITAKTALRPIDSLTETAEHIAETTSLAVPIPVRGKDEIARLAAAFNRMTKALAASQKRQSQLVADARHELMTPLTSLRTNIELLARSHAQDRTLAPEQYERLLSSLTSQVTEFAALVDSLSLLDDKTPTAPKIHCRFDILVERAIERASLRGDHRWNFDLTHTRVLGDPVLLERAALNLLDNAVKFSPPGSTITVSLRGGLLEVTDQGAGIAVENQNHIWGRFWRSPTSRGLPGSGLGLAIVADVARRHGGEVRVHSPIANDHNSPGTTAVFDIAAAIL